ncbi:luciferin 4-monooxygenase-like [Anopheles ziemanni]|uniref:luciferin 4-monooxygenase-like n=1 Tax=Anopheles coustani TaxID=139045 RepID=UPI00265A5B67|nr:luciferin 4-monooxygenase-like [Anopheles coustani]XP_058171553.1 luciferin 4-monooxygenase-like [Anopheles ziemanni]
MHTKADDQYVLYGGPDPIDLDRFGSLGEVIVEELRLRPANIGLIEPVTEEELSYGQILEHSVRLARGLAKLGVGQTDNVAIFSQNSLEYCIAMFGSIFVGSPLALLNPAYVEGELKHAIALAKPKVIFISPDVLEKLMGALRAMRLSVKVVLCGEHPAARTYPEVIPYATLLASPLEVEASYRPDPVDKANHVALIVLSSGTTGLPKGVELTHQSIIATIGHSKESAKMLDLPDQLVALAVTPLFHVVAGVGLLNMVTNNCRCVVMPRFDPVLFLRCIEHYRVNLMTLVPPLMVFLAKHPMVDDYDTSSLMTLFCGAAPLSREIEDQVRERLGVAFIRQGYGMSETTLGVLMQDGFENKAGSVGRVRMGQWVKVIDPETGRALGPNQRGELCLKGSLIMKGYVGRERAIDEDGWLHTGDIAYYDDDQEFFIVDRIKELIKYKGFQVPPAELEAILLEHPRISDAAVIGVPDERAGELPLAFVVKEHGEQLTEREVIDFVASKVSEQKRLYGGVRFVSEIPKTASGKILRRELRDLVKNTKAKL